MNKIIVSNQIKCNKCNDIIYSAHVHDFKTCKCGTVSVDGGTFYFRRLANSLDDYEEQSITMNYNDVEDLIKILETDIKEGKRNTRGILYSILRQLRDYGYNLNEKIENIKLN